MMNKLFNKGRGVASRPEPHDGDQSAPAPQYPPHVAPLTRDASARYFAAFQRPRVDQDRLVIAFAALFVIAILQAFALWQLIPLKQPIPFFITSDPESGAVYPDKRVGQTFTPTDANKAFFLRRWATTWLTIKPNPADTLVIDIPQAASWTAGSAVAMFEEYNTRIDPVAKRIAETKGLTREVSVNSTTFNLDGTQAYLLLTLTERINGRVSDVSTRLLTINFVLALDQITLEDVDDNPLGMKIDYFTLAPYHGPGRSGAK